MNIVYWGNGAGMLNSHAYQTCPTCFNPIFYKRNFQKLFGSRTFCIDTAFANMNAI